MSDTLEIFGKEYTNVAGFKAKDGSGNTLTYTRGGGGDGGNDFIITLSYDSTNEMWEPDCTFSEYATAFTSEKNIALKCNNSNDCSIVEMSDTFLTYKVTEEVVVWTPFLHGQYVSRYYIFNSSGITEDGTTITYSPDDTTATAADIASGKTAIIETGAVVGTNSGSAPTLQSKTATPSETAQTITADSGYDGLSSVAVGAISSTYVGSGITRRSSSDLNNSTTPGTIIVPAGYYEAQASKGVGTGNAGTPVATKGTVSNHSVSVTSSTTTTAGYISAGTKTGTAVTVSASELVSGTKSITANGTGIDVTNYAAVDVNVEPNLQEIINVNASPNTALTISPDAGYDGIAFVSINAIPSGSAGTPTAAKGTVSNHSITVTPSVTNTTGYITGGTKSGTGVTVSASELVSGSQTITANGTVDVTNLASVDVALTFSTIYTGTSTPSSSMGSNGDIYIKTS